MKILVACEESGIVRDAFIARGHDAISCDILPTASPGPHHQGPLEDFIGRGDEWDMIMGFPPCTYVCGSGIHWNGRVPGRAAKTESAIAFVKMIWSRKCPKIVIENPVGILSRPENLGPPSQIIQPWEFGHDASKKTCLWIKGLLPLIIDVGAAYLPRMVSGKPRWANQTDSGQNKLAPGPDRAGARSRTYHNIAKAMAEQWG